MKPILYVICCGIIFCSCNRSGANIDEGLKGKPVSANYSCGTPEVTDMLWYSSGKKAPLFKGLEGLHFKISNISF